MAEVSREYASALFELARENNAEKEFFDAMVLISDLFSLNPKYTDLLKSPCISEAERLNALDKAFKGKIPEYTLSFIKLLCKTGHIDKFSECFKEYEKMYMYFSRQSTACVTSAVPLTEKEQKRIKDKLEEMSGRTITLKYSVDKSLIGGIVAEIDGRVFDGSIRHKLNELKEVIDK